MQAHFLSSFFFFFFGGGGGKKADISCSCISIFQSHFLTEGLIAFSILCKFFFLICLIV